MQLISQQVIELGWQDTWLHEARNTRGEWTHGAGGLPVSHGKPQGRGHFERFAGRDVLKPSMDPATGHKPLGLPGNPTGAGTPDDPIDVRGDMPRAVQLMAAGRHVRLNSTGELPALESEINKQADAVLKSTGSEPKWDLGMVSVKGTRLFNEQNRDIPRIEMPQLSGPAQPGTEAAVLAHGANKFIELDPEFRRRLKDDGVDVKNEKAKVADLRATQTQLTAASVAGIARAAQQGNPKVVNMLDEPVWVSQDNYVIDGHHRWAAHAMMGDQEMNIQRIGLPASIAIPYANGFSTSMGIGAVSIGNAKLVNTANEVRLISQQFIDLSWKDAWRTELRGRHGEWTKDPAQALAGEKYPGQFSDHILKEWRGETDPTAKQALNEASGAYEAGDYPAAAHQLRKAQAYANVAGHKLAAERYGALAHEIASGRVSDQASEAAVHDLMRTSADSVPGMFGGNQRLDWDGKPPTLFSDASQPGLLAEVDWNGHVSMAQGVAATLADDKSGGPIDDVNAYTVPFHEMIHAVVPVGQKRSTNGDRQAYQNYASAQIEEGFTELGAIQHAADFFDQAGVGDRPVLDKGSLVKQQHLAEINGQAFTPDLTASKTMDDLATEVNDPARIKSCNAWGHYKTQVSQAYTWVSTIAQMHTGKGENDAATQDEILRLSDEVNAVGTAAKPRVMANHVIADMGLEPGIRDSVLDSTSTSLLSEWQAGNIQQAVAQVRKAAIQRVQALQAERIAA